MTYLEESIEDAIMSMAEDNWVLPKELNIWYTEEEWVAIERFHRLRLRKDLKMGIVKDRFPFIRLKCLGINVNLFPEPKYTDTIQ
jgi:hypothetical protein